MQRTFLLPVLATAVMAGCSSAPKQMASGCGGVGQAATAGYVAASDETVVLSGAGSLLQAGYWKPEHSAALDCDSKVMVTTTQTQAQTPTQTTESVASEGSVRLDARVLFDYDSALLTDSGKVELDLLINDINAMTLVEQIMVIGHTDSVGSMSYNQMLSERRAGSVRDYMAETLAELNIVAEGRGEEEPIADNTTDEGRAKNRRVEVIVDGSMEARMREASAPVIDGMKADS